MTRSSRRRLKQEYVTNQKSTQPKPERINKEQLGELQRSDPTLRRIRKLADSNRGNYHWEDGILTEKRTGKDAETISLLVLPMSCRDEVLKMALLDELADHWVDHSSEPSNVVEYMRELREKMDRIRGLVKENEQRAKEQHKKFHDRNTSVREFREGDMVLVLLPGLRNKLETEWLGPYQVVQRKSDVTYEIDMHDHKRTFHVNALKAWTSPVPAVLQIATVGEAEPLTWGELEDDEEGRTANQLSPEQQNDLKRLKEQFVDVISDISGRTSLVEYRIDTGDASSIRLPPYRTPQALREVLKKEVKEMLDQGIVVPSTSEWAAPVILVPKKDGTKRLCVDFRKLNHVTKADPYPIPRVEELIDRLGRASALDLTKGYWQVPVAEDSQHKTAFITPFGKYQFTTMPDGGTLDISEADESSPGGCTGICSSLFR